MMRKEWRPLLVLVSLLVLGVWFAPSFSPSSTLAGQTTTGQPSTRNGEWPHYTADLSGQPVLAARSDQRLELQQARGRVALQDRQPGPVPGVQARRHAAHGQGRALHDRGHATVRGRARPEDRRAHLDPQHPRRQARRDVAAAALGPRRVVLDRRQGRRADPLHDDGLSARRAEREDRPADQLVRHERHRRPEGRRRSKAPTSRSISKRARSASTRRRPWPATSSSSARRSARA